LFSSNIFHTTIYTDRISREKYLVMKNYNVKSVKNHMGRIILNIEDIDYDDDLLLTNRGNNARSRTATTTVQSEDRGTTNAAASCTFTKAWSPEDQGHDDYFRGEAIAKDLNYD
jgi:hypothetical protein